MEQMNITGHNKTIIMIIIPNRENRRVVQTSRSNILGDLWTSFNLDLQSNLGTIRISPRMKVADNSASESNMGLPIVFRHFNERIFTIAGTRVFYGDTAQLPNVTFTEDTETGAKTSYDSGLSDMEVFNGHLYTTTSDELMKKTGGTNAWSEIDSDFSFETIPHPLCAFKRHNRLYYADGDFIASINTGDSISSGSYEIDMDISWREVITCMKASASSIFIGTILTQTASNSGDMKGAVYEWDGRSSAITRKYALETEGVVAMCVKNDIPYIMDARGKLLEYRGNSFEEIGRLPYKNILPYNNTSATNNRFIHPNGLIPTENGFAVFINNLLGDNGGSIQENLPSGLWEWTPENGFVHKSSLTYTSSSTISDYGQNRISAAGAMFEFYRHNTSSSRNGRFLVGATYYTNASDTVSGIFYDDTNNTLKKSGYFVTNWTSSNYLEDCWQKIALKYRQLLTSTDKISIKYRKREADPIYISITWTLTNQFTTTTDVSSYVGYEVEVIQGTGSGKTAHISSVSGSGTYTVTLDDDFDGVSGTAKARLQNWTKVFVVNDQDTESVIKNLGDIKSPRIQVKCCMEFTGDDELHELAIINKQHTKLD